jgi:hypothetical protein
MKNVARRFNLRQMLLASVLFGALSGAFGSSGAFTQTAFSQSYGGGTGDCKDWSSGGTYCAATWCYYTIAGGPSSATCKYMRIQGTGTCPTTTSCKPS